MLIRLQPTNIFDSLPALAPPKPTNMGSELTRYLSADIKHVTDAVAWWYECCQSYPVLYHMALDYLTIPGKCILLSCIHTKSYFFSDFC